MIERATEWLRDPNLGLHVGQAMRPGYMGAHGFSLMACATVRDLLPRLQRYTILLYEGCRDEFEERDGQLQRLQTSAEPAWLQSCKGAIMNALRTGTPELEQIAPQLEFHAACAASWQNRASVSVRCWTSSAASWPSVISRTPA